MHAFRGSDNSCLEVERTSFTYMGYSIRTDRYRYTEWLAWNGSALAPARPLRLRASELYDHDGDDGAWTDPDGYENVNIVATAATPLISALSAQLRAAFAIV